MTVATILITGGAGFIGSHLCERFINDGHGVVCVDNFLSGSHDNLTLLATSKKCTIIEHDVCQPLPELPKLDAILHFASPASPNPHSPVSYVNHPIETIMVNTLGTQRLLELAKSNKCQIILASTSEVYGDPVVHPQPETYWGNVSSTGVRSCYDEGKRAMEALAFAYFRLGAAHVKVVRIFNTYGPRMRLDDGRFMPNLVRAILSGTSFPLFGSGDSTRSFCYIDDLIEGIMQIFTTSASIGKVINLGNPQEYALVDVIKLAEKISEQKLKIESRPALADDPKRRCPDISLARDLLGWEPKISLEQGLTSMLKSYR